MNVKEFQEIIYNENDKDERIFQFLTLHNLIHNGEDEQVLCPRGHRMFLTKTPKRADGYAWRCKKTGCQTFKSIRHETFFYETRIKIWKIFLIIFNWAYENIGTRSSQLIDVSTNTVSNYHMRLRAIVL